MLTSRISWGHGPGGAALLLNEHIKTDGTTDLAKINDTYVVDSRRFEPAFRDGRDPYHLAQGGALGRVHKGMLFFQLRGRILVPDTTTTTQALMADKERILTSAFDPALCVYDSPSTEGAYPLDWTEPTADTANFPTGIPTRLYCRPTLQPLVEEETRDRSMKRYAIGLLAGDPRKYHQTESTLVLTPASPTNSVVNRGTAPSALKATIVMAGAGNAAFRIARGGVTFEMNLTGTVNLDQIVVIFETCGPYGRGKYITKNGVENAGLKTSAPDTWLNAPVGTTSFTISNTTNVTSCTLAWRHAWT